MTAKKPDPKKPTFGKHKFTVPRSRTREYRSWGGMKDRCYNENAKFYNRYGGRGITVCERWLHSFDNFLEDMGARPKNMTLDRIDNDGDYEPSNCRWATRLGQNLNRRRKHPNEYSGITKRRESWSVQIGVEYAKVGVYGIKDKLEAAWIYDQLAMQLHGELANLNFDWSER